MTSLSLGCPYCSTRLFEGGEMLRCDSCQKQWSVIDGIPRFVREPYYWGEIPLELMQQVNRISREESWRAALRNLVRDTYPDIYRYVIDHSRSDFGYYIPLNSSSVTLDIGSGWGTISCLLAARCGQVISVESVSERVEFLKIRAQQDGLENVHPVQASFLELPLLPSSLDLVVMNGVLEWVGIASEADTPRNLQRLVLQKLNKSLKPGGYLYIGIENRFGYNYFLGAKDHSDLPYTSLMPRWLANKIMQWKAQRSRRTLQATGSYRTYTHSLWGYKSLLRDAGFSNVQVYLVLPDYNHPAYLIPAEQSRAFAYIVSQMYSGHSWKHILIQRFANLAAPLGLQQFFTPCFSIFASKGTHGQTL